MNTMNINSKFYGIVLFLLIGMPLSGLAQTKLFDLVVVKTDGTELSFRIKDDYPVLQYEYGGENVVSTLEIQTAANQYLHERLHIPCSEIKRMYTREAQAALGDVNGDDKVDVADAVEIVNYVLGNPSAGFNAPVADVNGDGEITIADAVGVMNIIMNE